MSLRIGLVGAGLAARSHALDIVTAPQMELAGVTSGGSSSALALSETFGGTVHADLAGLLAGGPLDALVVAVPHSMVLDIAEQVPAGLPCLTEKPIATTAVELGRLNALERSRPLMIAPFNRRYQPHVRWMADLVARHEIGALRRIEARWTGPFRSRYARSAPTFRSAASRREGVLFDNGSHALDLISMALPDWRSADQTHLTSMKSIIECNSRGAEVRANLTFRLQHVDIDLKISDEQDRPGCSAWQIEFHGDCGMACVDGSTATVKSDTCEQKSEPTVEMGRPVADLIRLAEGREPWGAPLASAAAVSAVIVAAHNAGAARWQRPRAKALGRLNGSC